MLVMLTVYRVPFRAACLMCWPGACGVSRGFGRFLSFFSVWLRKNRVGVSAVAKFVGFWSGALGFMRGWLDSVIIKEEFDGT